jgi:hypothetical protein
MHKPITFKENEKANLEENLTQQDIYDREQLRLHQKGWSIGIGISIGLSILFCWLFIWGVGSGCMNYKCYTHFPSIVVTSFFAQIVGMGLIVSKCLFPKRI